MTHTVRTTLVCFLLALVWMEVATASQTDHARPASDADAFGLGKPALMPADPLYVAQAADETTAEPALESSEQEEVAEEPQEDQATTDADEEEPQILEPEPEPKPQLTTAQAALRDRVRRTLAAFRKQALNTRENTATEIMHYCRAFGIRSEVVLSTRSGSQRINGITCLCWNYPCAGYQPLGLSDGHISARIGYGRQSHPSQLLALLALARVKSDYPARVGKDVRTIADLVESEKLDCRGGADLSLKLIALSFYLDDDPTWQNRQGEDWSLSRIVKEELDSPLLQSRNGGTGRLLGLACALAQRSRRDQPIDGEFERAEKFVRDFQVYALKVQNTDGSWGPRYLAAKSTSRDWLTQLRATGCVLQWLAMSLPEGDLENARVLRSVEYLNRLLGQRTRNNLSSMKTRDLESTAYALHALRVYDQRFFTPRTPPPAPKETEQAAR